MLNMGRLFNIEETNNNYEARPLSQFIGNADPDKSFETDDEFDSNIDEKE